MLPELTTQAPIPEGDPDTHREPSDKPRPAASSPSKAKDASAKASSPLLQALPHPTDPARVVWYQAVPVKNHASGSKYVWVMVENRKKDQPKNGDGSQSQFAPAPLHLVNKHEKLQDIVMVHKRKSRRNKKEPRHNEAPTAEDDWVLDDFMLTTDKEECAPIQGLPMEEEEEEEEEGWEVITWDWF